MDITVIIFLLVYIAMGFGTLPGFKVDRTGAAVVGALALMTAGSISPKASWNAIDYRTVGMLFGLMVVSATFVVSGFYSWVAQRVASLQVSPSKLLAILVVLGGLLSGILTNDVVVVAMTPLLVSITLARGLNPVPFLLAFCFAANTGSAGTLIGSPQNMIAGQGLSLSFNGFLNVAALPALASLPIVWGIVAWIYSGRWELSVRPVAKAGVNTSGDPKIKLDVMETIKAMAVTFAVVMAFIFSPWPRELIALAAAGVLLVNRRISSSDMLKHVDGNLILLIMGLFVVNAALAMTGLPEQILSYLRHAGLDLNHPLTLFAVGSVVSNIVGNNPTVILLVPFLDAGTNRDALGAALALGTGFSSSLVIFGSLAGIIVVEQAAAHGVTISFKEFSLAGVPVAFACMAMAAGWIWLLAS